MPLLLDLTAPYSDLEAWMYDRVVAPAVVAMESRLQADMLPLLRKNARLLEVGCGGGQVAAAIVRKRRDVTVTGLDLSHSQVARAAQRARGLGERLRFVRGDALDLPFPDRSFDGVLSIASVKHWPDMERGLRECVRLLRRGGVLLVAEADRGCTHADASRFVAAWRIPAVLRPMALAVFRTAVAGRSIDLEDARRMAAGLSLSKWEVRRIAGTPALLLLGRAAR
jgi:ubiquinone/menaquinone biosynthesis C-methylase UbiE